MMRILTAAILVTSILTWGGNMTKTRQLGVTAELPGSSLKWIHIAEAEFDREKLNLDRYRLSVVEEEDVVVVIVTGLKQPKNAIGSVGPDPGYEVEIRKKDRKVLRSNYVR
jgi:hypothetical protein